MKWKKKMIQSQYCGGANRITTHIPHSAAWSQFGKDYTAADRDHPDSFSLTPL